MEPTKHSWRGRPLIFERPILKAWPSSTPSKPVFSLRPIRYLHPRWVAKAQACIPCLADEGWCHVHGGPSLSTRR
uniref:Uncharacterized protein n=1 Tax=Arundo donax TaxID=35708 RepID=A0A0A9H548_ARUDO